MEWKTEPAKGNNDKIRMLEDTSLKAILLHFMFKKTGQWTDEAHAAEQQKSIKKASKQPCYRSRCLPMLHIYKTPSFPYCKYSTIKRRSTNV